MIYIGRYKELNPKHDYPSIKDFFLPERYPGQDRIVYYLFHGKEDMVSTKRAVDVITGEPIKMEIIGMNDGMFTWFNTLGYYVDKYNLKLPKEFEDHILSS